MSAADLLPQLPDDRKYREQLGLLIARVNGAGIDNRADAVREAVTIMRSDPELAAALLGAECFAEYASHGYRDGQPIELVEDLVWHQSPIGAERRRDWHRRKLQDDPTWTGEARVLRRYVIHTEPRDITDERR